MLEDVEEIQRGTIVLDLLGRGSRDLLHWASYLKGKKDSQGQNKRESWEVEACREGGEKEAVRVSEITLEQGSGWGYCPFGEYWGFLGCRV